MRTLIVGHSGGIGQALVRVLSAEGAEVHGRSRSTHGLDLTDEGSITAALADVPAPLDMVWICTGVLEVDGVGPERRMAELDAAQMARVLALNTIGPALVLKHIAARLVRPGPSHVGVLSARLGSIGDNGLGGWTSYRASKAALNQIVRCAAIEIGRKRPHAVLASLHPGTIPTEMTTAYARGRYTHEPDEAAANLLAVLRGLGPSDSGGFFDYAGARIPF